MSAPIIIGNGRVHDHHTAGRVVAAERISKTFVKQGKYDDLAEIQPFRGDLFKGLRVLSSELVRSKGGMGLLTVTCATSARGGGSEEHPGGTVLHEVEMAQLEKPLLSKPGWDGYAAEIEQWKESPPELRAALKYEADDGRAVALSSNAQKIARLLLKGVESYLLFVPVCRRTTRIADGTEAFSGIGGACGKRNQPPRKCLAMAAGNWDWLKTADRAVETAGGGAERVEEWTAADEWDKNLYETV